MSAEETTMIETKDDEERGEWRFETLKSSKINTTSYDRKNFDIVDNPDEILNLLKPGKDDDNIEIRIEHVSKSNNSMFYKNQYNIHLINFYKTTVCEDSNVAELEGSIWGLSCIQFDCIRLGDKFYVESDNKYVIIRYRNAINFLNEALGLNRDIVKSAAKR